MAETVKEVTISLLDWNNAASKTAAIRRAGCEPAFTLAVFDGDDVDLTEYDEAIEVIDTEAGTATVTLQAWEDAQDKAHLIRRLGLDPADTDYTVNEDGTVDLAPPA